MQSPTHQSRRSLAPRRDTRRPRVPIVDTRRIAGDWGFAPGGEGPAFARGRLVLEPSGRARWQPPNGAEAERRNGLWCIEGSSMILALDGGALVAGPVVTLQDRILWGRGTWVRLPRASPAMTTTPRARPLPVGTRVIRRSPLQPMLAAAASIAAAALALSSLIPA